jgi:hypothetical protein
MKSISTDSGTKSRSFEAAIVGTLLESNGAGLPPNLARLEAEAPDSFDCPRCGEVAAAIRGLRREGRAVHAAAVVELVKFEGASIFLSELVSNALPLELAEFESQTLWNAYRERKLFSLFGEAADAVKKNPEHAQDIAQHVKANLEDLVGDLHPEAWLPLVEDAADIITRELPPVVQIVDGIVTEGSKLVIGSGSKTFKTWLSMDLALSVAHGIKFLERKTTRRRVLYVNLELKAATFQRRLQAIAGAKNITVDREWFLHLPLRGKMAGLSVFEFVCRIIRIAEHFKAGLAVLDPIYKANLEGEENNSRDQTLFFNQLDRITTEAGCTLILNDHFSKGNQSEKDPLDAIRGSSAKGGDVDAAMVLRKHEVQDCFRVDLIHRELPPVEPFCLGWNYPLLEVRADLDPDEMKRVKAGRRKEHDPRKLLDAISDTTAENAVSILAWSKAAGVPRQTLTEYLSAMRSKGWITTVGSGNSARQHITMKGLQALEETP